MASKSHKIAGASFNRPANTTQYAANELVANNATAGSVAPAALPVARIHGGLGIIRRVRLLKSNASLTAASFRVHLFAQAPTVTSGDNATFAVSNGAAKGYLGRVDVTMDQALGDGAFGAATAAIVFDAAPGNFNVYALIETLGTYTPASAETFTVQLEAERD